ncbi:ribonuclease HI [Neorhizobium galegae]|uniref:ribonuclease H family protein n=1 Tax=Neorhizobium galegae TaxID=399 RepID=UPI0021050BE5|nr:ribonuclease H [Neorhizobium galegae]MCQ1766152.1 ribonuclease HI [Neorhizobium galegae]MCQ1845066.1 ribonuclease HI [Neorhizobium galegae]
MFGWPEGLDQLESYLRKSGADTVTFKTARQAAFVAQQLLGTRVKFPAPGSDMTSTLILIQKAGIEKGMVFSTTPSKTGQDTPVLKSQQNEPTKGKVHKPHQEFAADMFAAGFHAFCDGACQPNPGAGGWGVVIYLNGVEIASDCGGDPDATNNTMELTALLNAIEKAALCFGNSETSVTIWCDSQYCVKGANEWRHGWKKNGWSRRGPKATKPEKGVIANLELWKEIDAALNASPALTIKWVKGHIGIVGNERADELSLVGRQRAIEQARLEAAPPALAIPVGERGQSARFGFAPVDIQNIGGN